MAAPKLAKGAPMKPTIVHFIREMGLGGDTKNLIGLCLVQRDWANVAAITWSSQSLPDTHPLPKAGVPVTTGRDSPRLIAESVAQSGSRIVVFHRNGAPSPEETPILRALASAGIRLFEYNTFARVDDATDSFWTGHCHLSRAALMQYAARRGVAVHTLQEHAAMGYAVRIPPPIGAEERAEARSTFGVPQDSFVVVRLQRPDLRKWSPVPVIAVAGLIESGVRAHLLVRAAPVERSNWVKQTCRGHATLLPPTSDEGDIRRTIAAADVMLNYSNIGETFGLALAEGMAAGLPVVVNSTPDLDNAQVEHCQHGETGLVANRASSLGAALRYLSAHPSRAARLGEGARKYIIRMFSPDVIDARLRRFLATRLSALQDPLAETIPLPDGDERYRLDDDWISQYELHARTGFEEPGQEFALASDRVVETFHSRADGLAHAMRLGPKTVGRVVLSRIRAGTLRRG